jgi:hypothetical protein
VTRTRIDWAVDILLIGWTGLMIALAIMVVWCLVDITRDRARGDHRRRRGRADIKGRPPRARVG